MKSRAGRSRCCGLAFTQVKHLVWLLCSGIIHARFAAAIGAPNVHSADPVELRPSQFSHRAARKGDWQTQYTSTHLSLSDSLFRTSDWSEIRARRKLWALVCCAPLPHLLPEFGARIFALIQLTEIRAGLRAVKPSLTTNVTGIHLIPKWRPINYSFVCRLISPWCLVSM